MKNRDLIKMLSESLSVEEIPVISNLEELKAIVDNSNISGLAKAKMLKHIDHLIKDTLQHARIITRLIKGAVK